MLCKRCKAELPDGQRFCPACGALQPMICPNCGAESRAGSRTCSSCGKKLPMAERENKLVYHRRKRHRGSAIATAIITLGALFLLGGAAMYLKTTLEGIGKDKPVSMEQQMEEDPVVEKPEVTPEENLPETPEPEKPEKTEEKTEEETEEETTPEEDTPAEEKPEEPVPADPLPGEAVEEAPREWMFPDSSERLLTQADIEGLTQWELKVARNEIYARHGRLFTSKDLQAHFNACSWYKGTIAPENFSDTMLNTTELANVKFLKNAE